MLKLKKEASPIEIKKSTEKKDDIKKKEKTIQDLDREKLEKKFNKDKGKNELK